MLLEGSIGDSFGAGFEFAPADFVQRHVMSNRHIPHPHHRLKPGVYTDDTQASLALAELLVDGEPWTREVIAQKFVDVFKRDPREGYSKRFFALLQECGSGDEFLAKIQPGSNRSGAAMRASC